MLGIFPSEESEEYLQRNSHALGILRRCAPQNDWEDGIVI